MYVSSIPRQVLEIPTINHGNFYLEKILFRKKKFLESTVGTIALPPLGSSAIGRQRDSGGMFQTTVACAGMFTFPCGQESPNVHCQTLLKGKARVKGLNEYPR